MGGGLGLWSRHQVPVAVGLQRRGVFAAFLAPRDKGSTPVQKSWLGGENAPTASNDRGNCKLVDVDCAHIDAQVVENKDALFKADTT